MLCFVLQKFDMNCDMKSFFQLVGGFSCEHLPALGYFDIMGGRPHLIFQKCAV